MKPVYSARDRVDAHLVKDLLEDQGINAVVNGDSVIGWPSASEAPVVVASVCVSDDDSERALKIVNDYEFNRNNETERAPWNCAKCGELNAGTFEVCWKCEGGEAGEAPSGEADEDEPNDPVQSRRFIYIAILLIISPFFLIGASALDAMLHGPYAQYYNYKMEALVENNQLIGKPDFIAREVLGKPSDYFQYWSEYEYSSGNPAPGAVRTGSSMNYRSSPFVPFGQFQVHVDEHGIVRAIELLDD